MKYNIIALLFATIFLISCGEDRTYEYLELTQENQWIFQKMQNVYLWNDSIKEPKRQSFFAKSNTFFQSLLESQDKFSHFADSATNTGYGISYAVMRDPLNIQRNKYYALVLFVEPGSPAAIAGLKRGDWITKVGENNISSSNYGYLDRGDATTIYTSNIMLDEENMEYTWLDEDTLQMNTATTLSSCGLYLDTIYTQRSHKIGYIVYNSFTTESKEKTTAAIEKFKQQNITELIIDLRYNNGGSIAVASELASTIIPADNTGKTFCKLTHNSLSSHLDTVYSYTATANTLSLNKIYIISGTTTRGAAETFICALQNTLGYNNAMVIGEKTVGENIEKQSFESPFNFTITPATAYIEDGEGAIMYPYGITPNQTINELKDVYNLYSLGNTQEYMLYNTIYYIVNGTFLQEETLSNTNANIKNIPAYNRSISR
ncbi:MAG: hypothetical protein IIV19_07060 [Bacteroidaceae bacterium]|nr:hypothetical protein [Bacteroidaceae bacterium]